MIGASLPHGRYSPQDNEIHLPNFFFRVLIILLLGTLTSPLEDSRDLSMSLRRAYSKWPRLKFPPHQRFQFR